MPRGTFTPGNKLTIGRLEATGRKHPDLVCLRHLDPEDRDDEHQRVSDVRAKGHFGSPSRSRTRRRAGRSAAA
jgi:hypothetical protein